MQELSHNHSLDTYSHIEAPTMILSRTTTYAALALTMLVLSGCAGESTDGSSSSNALSDGMPASETAHADVVVGETKSFAGFFKVDVEDEDGTTKTVAFEFTVSKIDWENHSARWDAKVIDNGGLTVASDDVNKRMTVHRQRCPGCFHFHVPDLVTLGFKNGASSFLTYEGLPTTDLRLESPNESTPPTGEWGSCSLICDGAVLECSHVSSKDDCASSLFSKLPRCIYELSFDQGSSCSD